MLGLYFKPTSFTPDRYDEAVKQLDAVGAGSPEGRLYHVALEVNGLIEVFDVWESQETFEAFGAALLPVLSKLGVDPGAPQVMPVRNVIKG